jgi:hypothetical protein
LSPDGRHFSIQSLPPGNRTERFGNVFLPEVLFSLTASITPMAIEKWAMQSAASAPAIRPPTGFPLHVDRTCKVDLGEQIFSFFCHRETFLGSPIPIATKADIADCRRSSCRGCQHVG